MAHERLIKEGKKALKEDIKPQEIEDYFRKKGMDKKEANEAIEKLQAQKIIEDVKKAAKEKASNKAPESATTEKKSSFGFWFIILLIIGIIVYLFYAGYISPNIFKNINFK